MRVGAVIVSHNQIDLARNCATVVCAEIGTRYVSVVINDRDSLSPDAHAELGRLAGTVIVNDLFAGYGANLNRGVRSLPCDVDAYLLLNDDALPEPGAIDEMVAVLRDDPRAGLVGPRLLDGEGAPQPSAYRFPSVPSEACALLLLPSALRARVARRWIIEEPRENQRVDWVVGAAMLARAEAFHAVNGFDESFFLYSEETDLARRMRRSGWYAVHCVGAVVTHLGSASTEPGSTPSLITNARGRYIEIHWRVHERLALAAALAVVHPLNVVATLARSAADVPSFPDRWRFLLRQRDGRPRFRIWGRGPR